MKTVSEENFWVSSAHNLRQAVQVFLTDEIKEITPAHINEVLSHPTSTIIHALANKPASANLIQSLLETYEGGGHTLVEGVVFTAKKLEVHLIDTITNAEKGKVPGVFLFDEMPTVFIPSVSLKIAAVMGRYMSKAILITSDTSDIINSAISDITLENATVKIILSTSKEK